MPPARRLLCILFLCAAGCSTVKSYRLVQHTAHTNETTQKAAAVKQVSKELFIPGVFTGSNRTQLRYRLLTPALHDGRRCPLIVVFHGSGAIGTDNESQLGVLSKLWATESNRIKYPCYVLVPQFAERSANYHWDTTYHVQSSLPGYALPTALELADSLKQHLAIDSDRIYVTGFSMGASAAVNALSLRPRMFAAGIAIAGIPNFNRQEELLHTPLWIIHGNADTENTFAGDSLFYKQMKLRGATKICLWELDKTGHEIIPELYTGDAVPRWLFGKKK